MKSAYELAMERFDDGDDHKPLTEAQKQQLADIDEKFKAKIAEREIFLKEKLAKAEAEGQFSDAEDLRKQLANERARLEDEREFQKDKVRKG
ncbi:MAG: hypothetical protein AAGB46_14525 [Verrucomicrobiota bacterium]